MASARRRPIWRRVALWAFAVGLVVVAVLLLLPAKLLPEADIWDKLEHAGTFFLLTVTGLLAFRGRGWWLAFGLIAFGSTCEILQIFVPGRNAALGDALANALGVCCRRSACAAYCAPQSLVGGSS